MSEILGSTGTSSPINPIRKKELDDNWKTVAAKAVTDDSFKKILAGDPIKVLGEHGLKVTEGIKINFDETNKEYNFNLPADASEEIVAEATPEVAEGAASDAPKAEDTSAVDSDETKD